MLQGRARRGRIEQEQEASVSCLLHTAGPWGWGGAHVGGGGAHEGFW